MIVFIFMIGIFVNATALSALIVTNTSNFNSQYNYTQLMTVEVALIENASASNWVASGFNVGRRTTKYNFDLSVSEVHTTYDGLYPDRDVYYSYDDCGRKTGVLVKEHRTRDGVAHTDSATIKYEYGPTGLMEAVVMGPSRKKITYDIHGWQVKAETELHPSYGGDKYIERLYYADTKAAHPRYNGFVSRKEWQKHAYDYEYDPNGFLIDAAYSELPGNTQATGANQGVRFDRSVSFEYDIRGNVNKIKRKGVIDRHPSGKLTFGLLDNLEAKYTGNRLTRLTRPMSLSSEEGKLQTNDMDMTAAYGRIRDFGVSTPDMELDYAVEVFKPKYDAAGRLVSDDSRNVTNAGYDNNGYLTEVAVGGCSVKYRRDGFGNLLSAEYSTPDGSGKDVKGDMSDRTVLYDGDGHMAVNGTLEMSRFEGGYFNADGKPHYYLTDYQGNVVRVIDKYGVSRQGMDYYPYGEPWVEWNWTLADTYPTFNKNRFLYGGKERITQFGLELYNFEARMYRAPLGRFSTPDKKALDTPWLSPFAYCACNPVNYKDPTGEVIETLWDIANVVYDAGAAIYNHITGDHEAAKSNWIDAGLDLGAALLPGLPAGISKAGKALGATKNAAKANSVGKLKNASRIKEGRAFQNDMNVQARKKGIKFASNKRLVPLNDKGNIKGNITDVDQLIKNPDGTYTIIEFKLTKKTHLSKGQKAARKQVEEGNGLFEIQWDIPDLNLEKKVLLK